MNQKEPTSLNIILGDKAVPGSPAAFSLAAVPRGSVPASTMGWDIVNSISEERLNSIWNSSQSGSQTFAFDLGGGVSGSGSLGKFLIHDGGARGLQGGGAYVFLAVPIESGTVSLNGVEEQIIPGNLVIQTGFEYSPPIPVSEPATQNGTKHALIITWPDIASPTIVIDYQVTGSKSMSPATEALLRAGLGAWLQDPKNRNKLPVLKCANVTLNKAGSAFPWLSLTAASYAYLGSDAGGPGAVAVLGMTEDNPTPGQFHLLAPDSIPIGSTTAALIGNQTFVREIVLPGAIAAFDGANPEDFELENDDTMVILNASSPIDLPPVIEGNESYYIEMTQFSVNVDNQVMTTFLEVKTALRSGVTLYVDITAFNGLELIEKDDGTKTISYTTLKPNVVTHRVHNSDGAIITKVFASLILALVFGVGGAIEKTIAPKLLWLLVATLIKGTVMAAEETVPRVLDQGAAAALPSVDEMVEALESSVDWAPEKGKMFRPKEVQLNGSVQFYGDFK